MTKEKNNLTLKNIKEFTSEDTIYIRTTKFEGSDFPRIFLCQFIKFEGGRVYGKAISHDADRSTYQRRIEEGLFIDAKLTECALYGPDGSSTEGRTHYQWFDAIGFAAYPPADQTPVLHQKDHPSYGLVRFTRSQASRGHSLFGSSLKHHDIISLEISRAELNRGDLNYDSYYAKEHIIEVNMSESQFAEIITTFNRGTGTPVTITYLNGKRIEECPFVSKTDQFSAEFKQKMKNLTQELQQTVEKATTILSSPKAISKGERDIIQNSIERLAMQINSNIPFINDQFATQMEKTVTEAKASIEAFLRNRSKEYGVALGEGETNKVIELHEGEKK